MTISYRTVPSRVLYAVVNYNDTGIDTGVAIGTIPASAKLLPMDVYVSAAFNAGSSNNLLIGFSAGATELGQAGDTLAGTAGLKSIWRGATQNPLAATRTVYVKYQQTGAAASAGKAYIAIRWTP